jgi:hypothetical protein
MRMKMKLAKALAPEGSEGMMTNPPKVKKRVAITS